MGLGANRHLKDVDVINTWNVLYAEETDPLR